MCVCVCVFVCVCTLLRFKPSLSGPLVVIVPNGFSVLVEGSANVLRGSLEDQQRDQFILVELVSFKGFLGFLLVYEHM